MIGQILISFDDENKLMIYDSSSKSTISSLDLLQPSKISVIIHPSTYINKILVAFGNGHLELWNFVKSNLVYTFQSHVNYFKMHKRLPSISTMEQSPACDVIAVGFSSGDILLMNLKLDIVLFSFKQDGGQVTSLSFRTDPAAQNQPFMVSGTTDGRIHVWNLGRSSDRDLVNSGSNSKVVRRLEHIMSEAHCGLVSKICFLHGEPIMISMSHDNSLKMWIFDNSDGAPRLLRCRQGHFAPSHRIRFYGGVTNASIRESHDNRSLEILSAGNDRTFRYFNAAIESQNKELSQKPILSKIGLSRRNERLAHIIDFDSNDTREKDWSNVITIHKDDANAYLWKLNENTVTEHILRQSKQSSWEKNSYNFSSAVALSTCGNFAVIGTRGGMIYKYNVQSTLPRGRYPAKAVGDLHMSKAKSKIPGNVFHDFKSLLGDDADSNTDLRKREISRKLERSENRTKRHFGEVTGLFIDISNSTMISCGLDGNIICWDFMSHECKDCISNTSPQILLRAYRDGNFFATVSQDRIIRIFDLPSFSLSRRFSGHEREITDCCFTSDGRRLISSSIDGSLRTWDIPTGRCISWLLFESPILSIAISPSNEFLCVSQTDSVGISMYVDRSMYETFHFWKEPSSPTPMTNFPISNDLSPKVDSESFKLESNDDIDELISPCEDSQHQKGDNFITLSNIPKAYWVTLFHLEAIKKRNRTGEPSQLVSQAPFFLPTINRENSAPSFPTPEEFLNINRLTSYPEKKRSLDSVEIDSKRTKTLDAVESELQNMSTVWSDEDGEDSAAEDIPDINGEKKATFSVRSSRIIRKDTHLPRYKFRYLFRLYILMFHVSSCRCKLAEIILKEFPGVIESHFERELDEYAESPILAHLMKLSPSAVDVEMRSLCMNDVDTEGLSFLRAMILMFTSELQSRRNFEVLEAYLNRFLTIHNEILGKEMTLTNDVTSLKSTHDLASNKFRHILERNVCILKVFAQLPSV